MLSFLLGLIEHVDVLQWKEEKDQMGPNDLADLPHFMGCLLQEYGQQRTGQDRTRQVGSLCTVYPKWGCLHKIYNSASGQLPEGLWYKMGYDASLQHQCSGLMININTEIYAGVPLFVHCTFFFGPFHVMFLLFYRNRWQAQKETPCKSTVVTFFSTGQGK